MPKTASFTEIQPASSNYFYNYEDGNHNTIRSALTRQNLHKNVPVRANYYTYQPNHYAPIQKPIVTFQRSSSPKSYPMIDLGYSSNAYSHAPEIEASPQLTHEKQYQSTTANPGFDSYLIPERK